MKRVMILGGAGRVASVIADQLKADYVVLTADRQDAYITSDLRHPDVIADVVSGADLAVNCLPGALGEVALAACIEAGVNVLDVSFMAEDAWNMAEDARDRGVAVLSDFGVAPGLSNILAMKSNIELGPLKALRIYVGGFPVIGPYKTPFSPDDVIEEYTRPARIILRGEMLEVEALSGVEQFAIRGEEGLEAFYTDGLRSLARSITATNAWEKTIRHAGHAESMGLLRQIGVFDSPERLKAAWAFAPDEPDVTLMRIAAETEDVSHEWELVDVYNTRTQTLSMSRCTGIPAAMGARFLLEGLVPPGVHMPEWVATRPELVARLLAAIEGQGIDLKFHTTTKEA